jgi:hypothetical protein
MNAHITTGALSGGNYLALRPESLKEAAELVKLMSSWWASQNPSKMELVPSGMDSFELRLYLSERKVETPEERAEVNVEHAQEA